VIKKSPGPFQLFVVPAHKVTEVDDEDRYDKDDAIEIKILDGKLVMKYMDSV